MRTSLAWTVALLLQSFGMAAHALPATASGTSQKYPPLRLAGPAAAIPATPATPATPAVPATPATPATPAAPATPATPTSPPAVAAAPAADDALDSLAQQHYNAGVEMFRNGQYEASRVEFEAAYKLLPLPDFLHNLSMAAELQKKYADALTYEERFLAAASHLTHSERTVTRNRIAKLRDAAGGTTAGSSAASGKEGGRSRTPTGALALIGIGSGMLLVGIGCGAGALVTQNKLENGEPLFAREYEALTQRGRALNYTGISLDVLGGVALVSGAAWAIAARTRAPKPQLTTASSLFSVLPQAR